MEPGGAFGFPIPEALGQTNRDALGYASHSPIRATSFYYAPTTGSAARTICHADLDAKLWNLYIP